MKYKSDIKKPLKTFSISEERVRRLENILDNDLGMLKEPKLKNRRFLCPNFLRATNTGLEITLIRLEKALLI